MFVAVDGKLLASLGVADPVKAVHAGSHRRAARRTACRIVMLTGDNATTAERSPSSSASTRCDAGVEPGDKSALRASAASSEGQSSRWPATASTTRPRSPRPMSASRWAPAPTSRSKAPASRWSKAICAASTNAIGLSRATMRNIRQNLFFAFVYNALGIPIAAGVLYPVFGILLSPMIAGAAMSFSSVSVIANALRLRTLRLD